MKANRFVHWRNYVGPRIVNVGDKKRFVPSPMSGLPDVIGITKDGSGKMFAIEVKNSVGKLSDKQIEWIRTLEKAGALVIIARDLQTVIDVLTKEVNKNGLD